MLAALLLPQLARCRGTRKPRKCLPAVRAWGYSGRYAVLLISMMSALPLHEVGVQSCEIRIQGPSLPLPPICCPRPCIQHCIMRYV